MDAWTLSIAADERFTLFPSPPLRRRAVRALVRVGGPGLLLFFVADDHLHAVVAGSREHAGRFAQATALALRPIAASGLQPARIRPIESRRHLESQVPYLLGQLAHHGLPGHPAEAIGSCFPDLVGARVAGYAGLAALREALPRLTSAQVYGAVRLPVLGRPGELGDVALPALVRHVADAVCVDDLATREPAVVRARATVARLAAAQGYQVARVAEALGMSVRQLRRLAEVPAWPELEMAIRMQVAIRRAVAGAPDERGTDLAE